MTPSLLASTAASGQAATLCCTKMELKKTQYRWPGRSGLSWKWSTSWKQNRFFLWFKRTWTFSSTSAEFGSFNSSFEDHLDLVNEEKQGCTLKCVVKFIAHCPWDRSYLYVLFLYSTLHMGFWSLTQNNSEVSNTVAESVPTWKHCS